MKNKKIYPDSGVELNTFISLFYDSIIDIQTLGLYRKFINQAIKDMNINPNDTILDLGCGTGRNASLMLSYLNNNSEIIGIDLSPIMKKQFEKRFEGKNNITFIQQRIDIPFDLQKTFDIVFISFVIHGFPQEVRKIVIENAKRHLKQGGRLIILDYSEFDMEKMPLFFRFVFKRIECSYAFDYIKRNWVQILRDCGFEKESEKFYFKNYVRLLIMRRI